MARIYLRNHVWYSDYWLNGERIRKPLSKNRREAQDMQDQMEATGRYHKLGLVPQQMSLKTFQDLYFKKRKAEKSANTYTHTTLAFRRLEDAFHIRYLSDITPELLEKAKIEWTERGHQKSAIASYVCQIKKAMRTAEAWRYVQNQSWNIVESYHAPGRLIYYTMDQYQKLVSKTSGWSRTAILLMGRAGLRSAECRFLEWEDIRWGEHALWIHAKPFWKPKGWKINSPKERIVDMPIDLETHLQSLPRGQGFVLSGEKAIHRQVYWNTFRTLIDKCGLRGSAHSFRHTYASWLISAGCTLSEVGTLLGHTDPKTTMIYAHMMPHARRAAVNRLPPFVSSL